ncbi:hypothetical protein CDAR_573411 [Caerostris darwini]|uniref:G-protein coupled receptors family 1 profile domain-containing protein n=1 Tax=Caerostris darwini TaxID=1538125 RepID=A0AAV4VQU5_9ARAC|nr:hypothetical protein CDAR_573411 [Caerostris darwini]
MFGPTYSDLSQESHYRRRLCLRRSDIAHMERARARTLRMTIVIVLTFFLCWTPYVVMVLWYLFDPVSAEKVDSRIQSSLFMFAVSNSCVNPLVYGSYVLNFKEKCMKFCCGGPAPISGSMSHTQISTPANKLHFVGHHNNREVSVHLNMNGTGTYPVLVRDLEGENDPSFPPVEVRKCRCNSSCSKNKDLHASGTTQKVEVVIHSLEH